MTNERTSRSSGSQRPRRFRSMLLGSTVMLAAAAAVFGPAEFRQAIFAAATPTLAHAAAAAGQGPAGFAPLVDKVKSAVVSVRVRVTEPGGGDGVLPIPRSSPYYRFFKGQGRQQEIITGEGSGFFISSDGYIVTNNHVADHAKTVKVTTVDGDIYTAKVVGTDPRSDLALLKVDANNKQFPFVKFADHAPQVGDWVMAVGNPFGLGGTVTAGIVSARGRDIGNNPYDDYLQIDAPINKGNSGGPAFNMNGNVVGVNTAIYSPSGGSVGIGFDIPADTAKMVISQLKDKGYVTRGWMGVQIQPVTANIADSLGMKKAEGALVDEPQPNSPAADAGIKAGDVITAVNGQSIKDARTLAQKIGMIAPGSKVQVTLLRKGQSQTVDMTLGTMPKAQQHASAQPEQPSAQPQLGLSLAPAKDVEGSGGNGVVVLGVDPDGAAAQNGLHSGDIIVSAAGKAVETPSEVRQAVDQTRSQGRRSILMQVKTAEGTRFVAMPVG